MTQSYSTDKLGSKSVPSAGMRGGLGRTLLTAFLLLSIVPLSIISFVASTQAGHNLERELTEKLVAISTLTESQIHSWIDAQRLILTLAANRLDYASGQYQDHDDAYSENPAIAKPNPHLPPDVTKQINTEMAEIQASNPSFMELLLLDGQGQILAAHPPISGSLSAPDLACSGEECQNLQDEPRIYQTNSMLVQSILAKSNGVYPAALMLTQPLDTQDWTLTVLLDPDRLTQTMNTSVPWAENGEIYLVSSSGQTFKLEPTAADNIIKDQPIKRHSIAIDAALAGQSSAGSYENYEGISVIGAYRWLPELKMALLVEQPRQSALASSDELAVLLIGATLAVALLTALIAATVTRRITLPIIQLTATAVQIASGDLDQKVPTNRRDEIGILARAFNVMTTKLRVLYESLEQKVKERTEQFKKASAEANYRAMQLAISAEIARVITSILEQERLIPRVVNLIRDCFQAYHVAFYFIDKEQNRAVLHESSGWLGKRLRDEGYQIDLSQDCPISRAVNSCRSAAYTGASLRQHIDAGTFPHTRAALVVPLKIGRRSIGVLQVHSAHQDAFAGDEIAVLETLAGQVAVAIENARVYEIERQAAEQLRELDKFRRRFLSNMSRELRVPLNNIIGFSRLMLKEIDGPVTDLQREDLNAIYNSGQRLLDLINDILDIAQIEAGTMELAKRPVDLGEIAQSLIPTTNALLKGRPIQFRHQVSPNLPPVLADPSRLRQVFIKLLSNAAKFTPEGEITLRTWLGDGEVFISISDTGVGIPEKYRDKVFEMFHQVSQPNTKSQGTGLGLTFSKEIIEMHGGTIHLESQEGKGTTFTIALPVFQDSSEHKMGKNDR